MSSEMNFSAGGVPPCRASHSQSTVLSGEGINTAQRVMDCGGAGHILASDTMAVMLLQLEGWGQYVRDWGECEVKHGQKVHLYGLAFDGLGNPNPPPRLEQTMDTPTDPWEREIMETSLPPKQRMQGMTVIPHVRRTAALPLATMAVPGIELWASLGALNVIDTAYKTTTGILGHLLKLD